MKITVELTRDQILSVIDYYLAYIDDEDTQTKVALRLFTRNESIDPVVALRKVVRQVARQYCLRITDVLKELK